VVTRPAGGVVSVLLEQVESVLLEQHATIRDLSRRGRRMQELRCKNT
jgi:hypothetical protein